MHDMAASDRNPAPPGMCAHDEESNSRGKAASAGYDCGIRKLTSLNSHSAGIPDMKWDGSVIVTWDRSVTVSTRRPNYCAFSSPGQQPSHPLGRLWEGRLASCLEEGKWRPKPVMIHCHHGGWLGSCVASEDLIGATGGKERCSWHQNLGFACFVPCGWFCSHQLILWGPGQGEIRNSLGSLGSLDLRIFQTHVRPQARQQSWFPLKSQLVRPGLSIPPTMPSRALCWATIPRMLGEVVGRVFGLFLGP